MLVDVGYIVLYSNKKEYIPTDYSSFQVRIELDKLIYNDMISNALLRYGSYIPDRLKTYLYPIYYYIRDIEQFVLYGYRQFCNNTVIEIEYGFRMSIDKSDFVQRRYLTGEGSSEDDFIECISQEMKEANGDFVDVGANVGFYSLLFASISSGSVFAFEPLNYNINSLQKNCELNGFNNISIFSYGISNQREYSTIHYYPFNKGAAGNSTSHTGLSFLKKSQKVKFERMDTVKELSDKISLIKIDVEGHELNVIKGSKKTIQTQQPDLFIEIHPKMLDNLGQSVAELTEYLFELGCTSIYLIEDEVSLTQEEAAQSIDQIERNHSIWCRFNGC